MPGNDMNPNLLFARKPEMVGCECGNGNGNGTGEGSGENKPVYPAYPCPPHMPAYPPPYPPPYPPVPPYPCRPEDDCTCGNKVSAGSIEAQIAKLSKKSATIRKMIDNLINRNKSIVISVGAGASYNFGTYMSKDEEETEYGVAVKTILDAELEAIKTKIQELAAELEVADESTGSIEGTVTQP